MLLIILLGLKSNCLGSNDSVGKAMFVFYDSLNNAEERMLDFKDSKEELLLKLYQLNLINASRTKHKRQAVQLDILASRVANKMCQEAAANNYVAHWNMKGEKPYHRYFNAGGLDHVAENAFGLWSSEKPENTKSNIARLMAKGHQSFMEEVAPRDGHKKNCLFKSHNFVGIGFSLYENNFRYYEEFIDRYYVFEKYPKAKVKVNEVINIRFSYDSSIQVTQIVATKEKKLKSRKPLSLTFKGSYLDGTLRFVFLGEPKLTYDSERNCTIGEMNFSFKTPGTYYLKIYHKRLKKGRPVGEPVLASGILITVTA